MAKALYTMLFNKYVMVQSSISVEPTTRDRFNARKGTYQASVGREVASDEFLNYLLDAMDAADKIAEEISTKGEAS